MFPFDISVKLRCNYQHYNSNIYNIWSLKTTIDQQAANRQLFCLMELQVLRFLIITNICIV
ncbi:hypothetical protein KIS4809_0464 [Bacillus sp. ZZV12-4809]|nr:hypothetical protein KIS4809_0464 [Bacillus sp. ZZV12-4809]